MNTKLTVLFNPIYNKRRRTTPKYFLVWFPGDWVALRSLWNYQPWALMDTLNPSYNQVLTWAVLAPMNGISLPSGCHHGDHVGLLCSSLPSVLCPKVARSTAKPKMPRDSLGQYSSKNNPTPTTVGKILQNLHTGWPGAHFHTVPQDLSHIIRKGSIKFFPSS